MYQTITRKKTRVFGNHGPVRRFAKKRFMPKVSLALDCITPGVHDSDQIVNLASARLHSLSDANPWFPLHGNLQFEFTPNRHTAHETELLRNITERYFTRSNLHKLNLMHVELCWLPYYPIHYPIHYRKKIHDKF